MKLPHQANTKRSHFDLKGCRAVIICTSQATLDKIDSETGTVLKVGKSTGVYASELTEAYYVFQDAQMEVDIASIKGGKVPMDPLSLMPVVRTSYDSKYLKDEVLQAKVKKSIAIWELDVADYDLLFLAGGWGAAYDFAQSEDLALKVSEAYALKKVLAAVCHGPLGFVNARKPNGTPLIEYVKATAVTNKQLKELFVSGTPKHPETELRKAGANYSCKTGMIDLFLTHTETDEEHLLVSGQNQKAGIETAQKALSMLIRSREV